MRSPWYLVHPKHKLFSIFPVGFCVAEAAFRRKWKTFQWIMGDSGYHHIFRPPFIPVFPAMLLYNDPFCDLWTSSPTSEAAKCAVELGLKTLIYQLERKKAKQQKRRRKKEATITTTNKQI